MFRQMLHRLVHKGIAISNILIDLSPYLHSQNAPHVRDRVRGHVERLPGIGINGVEQGLNGTFLGNKNEESTFFEARKAWNAGWLSRFLLNWSARGHDTATSSSWNSAIERKSCEFVQLLTKNPCLEKAKDRYQNDQNIHKKKESSETSKPGKSRCYPVLLVRPRVHGDRCPRRRPSIHVGRKRRRVYEIKGINSCHLGILVQKWSVFSKKYQKSPFRNRARTRIESCQVRLSWLDAARGVCRAHRCL